MEDYELDADKIISWAHNYAGYEELERVAKAIYASYVRVRKKHHIQDHTKNRKIRRQLTKTGEYRPKKQTKRSYKERRAIANAERQLALSAKRIG